MSETEWVHAKSAADDPTDVSPKYDALDITDGMSLADLTAAVAALKNEHGPYALVSIKSTYTTVQPRDGGPRFMRFAVRCG